MNIRIKLLNWRVTINLIKIKPRMKTKEEIEKQLELSYQELRRIEREVNAGNCVWRMQKSYCNALEFCLGLS